MNDNKEKIEDEEVKDEKRSGLMRIHRNLINSIIKIRKFRKKEGLKDISFVEISSLITKHKNYEKLESDVANYAGYEDE